MCHGLKEKISAPVKVCGSVVVTVVFKAETLNPEKVTL
jgi:hypothetical protein